MTGYVRNMKAYRIVTYVMDLNHGMDKDEIIEELTRSRYLSIETGAIQEIDIGEWDDDHPLNSYETDTEAYFQERIKKVE